MKKINLKKIILITIMIFISISKIISVEAATNAPSTVTMTSGKQLPGYINGAYFYKKSTTSGKYAYCLDNTLKNPANIKMTLSEAKDAGITYIIKNGYPNKEITGNDNYDYYITQSAVWWYLDDTANGNNLSNAFKTNGSDPQGLRNHIKKLVNGAKDAKKVGYTKPTMSISASSTTLSLSSDGEYYISDNIKINGTSISGKITLKLSGAPSGSKIINTKGTSITSIDAGSVVKIKVPANKITKLETSMTITATGTGKVDKAYTYKPNDSKYQPIVVGILYSETTSLSSTKKFTLKSTRVEISKIDSETGKSLSGAKMQLKNSKGKVVATWTSSENYEVFTNLPVGTYTLMELESPKGYKLNETPQEVIIKAGVVTKVSFYNTKKEPTKVVVIKRDIDTNATIAGAIFVLKNAEGKEITTWTSTKNGHYVSGLPEGEYTIEELNAPEGYIKSEEVKTVSLVSGKTITVNFYNKKEEINTETKLKISKVNGETHEKLAGATLELKNINGEVIKTWVTSEEDYEISNIMPGTYYLSEIKAPEGFVLSTEVMEINIPEDGGTTIVTFYNIPKIEVPNTVSNISKISIILGAIAMTIGGSIVYINLRKEEN